MGDREFRRLQVALAIILVGKLMVLLAIIGRGAGWWA